MDYPATVSEKRSQYKYNAETAFHQERSLIRMLRETRD